MRKLRIYVLQREARIHSDPLEACCLQHVASLVVFQGGPFLAQGLAARQQVLP